jgi:hypothetical protein
VRARKLIAFAAVALALAWALGDAVAQAKTQVDLELVLAVDVSMSMDADEQRLQRAGYVAAFRDPDVLKAIQAGTHGRIAVTYLGWAGPQALTVLVPWRLIDGRETAEAFVTELSSKEFSRHYWTSISAALVFSHRQFGQSEYRATRRVIDLSGDGVNNSGPALAPVREAILQDGVVINGLPILLKLTTAVTPYDAPDLDRYYNDCVIGGPNSFMIPIKRREEFATATRQKLLQEIAGDFSAPRLWHVQLGPAEGKYDCLILERRLRP